MSTGPLDEVQSADLRVSDDERRAVDALLHRAVGEGRLTLPEYEERAGEVWSARTRRDLDHVTRDLPATRTRGLVAPSAERRAVAVPRRRSGRLLALAAGTAVLVVVGGAAVDTVAGQGSLAVMSGTTLRVAAGDTDVDAAAVMGGAQVVVEGSGAPVEIDARSLMGGVEVVLLPPAEGAPPRQVDIDARTLMGGVRIVLPEGTQAALAGVMVMGGSTCDDCRGDRPTVVVDARGAMGGVEVELVSPAQLQAEIRDGVGDDRRDERD